MTHEQDERGAPLSRSHDPARKDYSARETRQGFLGMPVLKILLVSLVLVMLVWAVLEWWGNAMAPEEGAGDLSPPQTAPVEETMP